MQKVVHREQMQGSLGVSKRAKTARHFGINFVCYVLSRINFDAGVEGSGLWDGSGAGRTGDHRKS